VTSYYPSSGPRSIRTDLTVGQQGDLARLESHAGAPTDLQKGQLRALRLCAAEHDRARCEALQAKWGTT